MCNKIVKNIVVIFLTVVLISCDKSDLGYKQLKHLKPTLSITSVNLKGFVNDVLDDKSFVGIESEILVLVIEKRKSSYDICISKTDYNVFKYYRPEIFEKLVGYSNFQKVPLLIFGDIDDILFERTGARFNNFLGELPKYSKEFPPIIYEPKMICKELIE